MNFAEDFKLLTVLDSPLLPSFAPELVSMREKVVEILKRTGGSCTPCQQRANLTDLTKLQIELQDVIATNPQLSGVMPQLLATAQR